MLSLGIDPGLLKTGLALIEKEYRKEVCHCIAHRLIKINAEKPMQQRLAELHLEVINFINSLEIMPDIIGIEQTLCNINALSSLNLAMARGTIMSAIGSNLTEVKVIECNPRTVKRIMTGNGGADKETMKKFVNYYLFKGSECEDFKSYDEYDAVAIGYAAIALNNDKFTLGLEKKLA